MIGEYNLYNLVSVDSDDLGLYKRDESRKLIKIDDSLTSAE